MKILDGRELAGFIKERQAQMVRRVASGRAGDTSGARGKAGGAPKLLIIRDSDNPVIIKYVGLKVRYGEDIGVSVEDFRASSFDEMRERILAANKDESVTGIIVQLPIVEKERTDELCDLIKPEKDVDGLGARALHDSATATAINWLLAGYGIELAGKRIAIVGRGKLVGAPLYRMFSNSGLNVEMFHRGDDLSRLSDFDVIITATGVPGLIKSEMVAPGAVVVDAGTASEDGVLVGDLDASVRERNDLAAITPVVGGVGPLTIAGLFEGVIKALKV